MPKTILLRTILAVLLTASLAGHRAMAQVGVTYYHMFGVPQANQLNPAFQPGCDGFMGLPVLGPMRFSVETNSLRYSDIFEWNTSLEKYITFLHPLGDRQRFIDALKPVNTIRAEAASSLLSFGWRSDNLYFTFSFTERFIQSLSFPRDLPEFLISGNLNQSDFNFSDLGENLSYFHQLGIGVSYNLDDEMQFGVRAKLLLGGFNYNTRSSDISLKTSLEEWTVKSDLELNASIPFLENIPVDQEGYLDIEKLDTIDSDELFGFPEEVLDLLSGSGLSTMGGLKNPGFAIDLGFNYFPIEKLSISASLVDLGFIRWRNYVWNFDQELDYAFEGIEFKLEDDWEPGEGLLDSLLENDLKIKVTQDKYTTMMTGKIYLGAAYNLTEKVRFGGVFRTRIQNYKFYNQFTISANVQPISMFSASLSYSIYGNSYMNLGLGLSLRAGPLNLYFVTDQAPSVYFWPAEFSSLNFRMGLNIVWGCAALPRAMKDRPLID
jgi:hypothetical protein